MSRWVGFARGVVLVAITAPSGSPATRRVSHPPFRQAQHLLRPPQFRRRLLLRRLPSNPRPRRLPPLPRRKPRPRLRPCLRPRPLTRPPPRPRRLLPRRPPRRPPLRPLSRRSPHLRLLPPPRSPKPPAAARARTRDAGSPGRIRAQEPRAAGRGRAYSVEDCDRLFERRGGGWAYRQPVDKFAQAAIVEPKRILLPSATCRVESASEAEGALKVALNARTDYLTNRSVMISLRSATELLYSASGDPVLATTLRKCPP